MPLVFKASCSILFRLKVTTIGIRDFAIERTEYLF